MNLGQDIRNALPGIQSQADSLMTETIVAGLAVDGTDPVTGDATQTIPDPRYEGSARVKYNSSVVSDSGVTGALVMVQAITVKLPAKAPVLEEGDVIEVTESELDASLVGRKYIVRGAPDAGQVSAHRYPVTELS